MAASVPTQLHVPTGRARDRHGPTARRRVRATAGPAGPGGSPASAVPRPSPPPPAATPSATLTTTLRARDVAPSSTSRTVSNPNRLNVVNPPQNPVPSSATSSSCGVRWSRRDDAEHERAQDVDQERPPGEPVPDPPPVLLVHHASGRAPRTRPLTGRPAARSRPDSSRASARRAPPVGAIPATPARWRAGPRDAARRGTYRGRGARRQQTADLGGVRRERREAAEHADAEERPRVPARRAQLDQDDHQRAEQQAPATFSAKVAQGNCRPRAGRSWLTHSWRGRRRRPRRRHEGDVPASWRAGRRCRLCRRRPGPGRPAGGGRVRRSSGRRARGPPPRACEVQVPGPLAGGSAVGARAADVRRRAPRRVPRRWYRSGVAPGLDGQMLPIYRRHIIDRSEIHR